MMKKSKATKIIAVISTAVCLSVTAAPAYVGAAVTPDEGIVSPQNIAISKTSSSISISSAGVAACYGKTETNSGYTAGVVVELQRQDGDDWTAEKKWAKQGSKSAVVDEDYAVSKNYTYRLMVIHSAYNSSGSLVEVKIGYSY